MIAWQAAVTVIIAIAVTVPLGIAPARVALGRLADLRGDRIYRPGRDSDPRNSRHPVGLEYSIW
jgi:hypothetical protein